MRQYLTQVRIFHECNSVSKVRDNPLCPFSLVTFLLYTLLSIHLTYIKKRREKRIGE